MLLDLLCESNKVSFNIKVAESLGLHAAIYISELMNINEKAIRKDKVESINNKKYFTVDRKYLTARTTLSTKEQKDIEASLATIEILLEHPTKKDTFYLDIDALAVLLSGTVNTEFVDRIESIAKKKTKEELQAGKLKGEILASKKAIVTLDPILRNAWCEWIEVYANKNGYITPGIVKNNETNVMRATGNNLEAARQIVKYTAERAYQSMDYAIQNWRTLFATTIDNNIPARSRSIERGNEVF